jgi:DNA-binding HxlR family transcriptional regulator
MPTKRTYAELGDACATAHAMELIGDRWNYPLLRELMLAPKRFGELLASVRGITPAVLTSRLRELQSADLVHKTTLPAPARVDAYELTEWGRELDPIMQMIGRWAQESPTRTADGGLTPDATIQSMRTMAPPGPLQPPIELSLHLFDGRLIDDPGYDYRVSWGRVGLIAERGDNPRADTRIDADSSTWARVLYDNLSVDSEGIYVEGRREPIQRLIEQFAQNLPRRRPGSAPRQAHRHRSQPAGIPLTNSSLT